MWWEASMRRGMSLSVLVVVSAAGIAVAQTARLTAEEARRELYGVELAGVNESAGDEWRECIEPGGRTVYRRGGEILEGRRTLIGRASASFARAKTIALMISSPGPCAVACANAG
jgi:hypothetical protein